MKKPETFEDNKGNFFVLLAGYFYPVEQVIHTEGYKLVYDDQNNMGFVIEDQFITLRRISDYRSLEGSEGSQIKSAYIGCLGTMVGAIIGAVALFLAPQSVGNTICSNIGGDIVNSYFCNFGGISNGTPESSITPEYSEKRFITISARFDDLQNSFPATFECPATTRYRITIVDGAYSGWPNGEVELGYGVNSGGQWRTFILIYVDKPFEEIWGRTELGSPRLLEQPRLYDKDTHSVGLLEDLDNSSREQAISDGLGMMTLVACEQGQIIGFIPLDERGQYFDNTDDDITLSIEWNQ